MVSILDSLSLDGDGDPESEMEAAAAWVPSPCAQPRRLLVISDVHGNWPALRAVLEAAAGAYDTIWCLGDWVGYGPYPAHCVMFLQRFVGQACWCPGNHDMGIFRLLTETEFRFAGDAWAVLKLQGTELREEYPELWHAFERQVRQQPRGPVTCALGRGYQVFAHDNLEGDWEYLFPNSYRARGNVTALRHHQPQPNANVCLLAGHSHIPCLFHVNGASDNSIDVQPRSIYWGRPESIDGGRYYINPGSVGQPRDCNPHASYVILDTEALTATWHRVEYPVREVTDEMTKKGYPTALMTLLEQGGNARTLQYLSPRYRIVESGLEMVDLRNVER